MYLIISNLKQFKFDIVDVHNHIHVDEMYITLTKVHDTQKRNIELQILTKKQFLRLVTILDRKSHIAPVLKYIF